MANNLKSNIEYIGLNYKKEMTKLLIYDVIILGLTALAFIFLQTFFALIIGVVALIGFDIFIIYSYSSKKASIIKDHSNEFIHIITYFRIFIQNRNNVYQSFNKLLNYSSEWMKEQIEIMLRAIDNDKSIKPFTDFADKFDFPIARNVMVSIYQMIEVGEESEQLNQFTILFEQMSQTLNEEKKDRKNKSFDFVSFFPIIGAGLVTLALTFSMLAVAGDMLNVI